MAHDEVLNVQEGIEAHLSTYQWITAEQLLKIYGLTLATPSIFLMLQKKQSFYFQLLRLPVLILMNELIVKQVEAYRLYVQRCFVEYLMSGSGDAQQSAGDEDEYDEEPTETYSETQEELETVRQQMMALSDALDGLMEKKDSIVRETQAALIHWGASFNQFLDASFSQALFPDTSAAKRRQGLYDLFADAKGFEISEKALERYQAQTGKEGADLKSAMSAAMDALMPLKADFSHQEEKYEDAILALRAEIIQLRQQMYQCIVDSQQLMNLSPNFKLDEKLGSEAREAIQFDGNPAE